MNDCMRIHPIDLAVLAAGHSSSSCQKDVQKFLWLTAYCRKLRTNLLGPYFVNAVLVDVFFRLHFSCITCFVSYFSPIMYHKSKCQSYCSVVLVFIRYSCSCFPLLKQAQKICEGSYNATVITVFGLGTCFSFLGQSIKIRNIDAIRTAFQA